VRKENASRELGLDEQGTCLSLQFSTGLLLKNVFNREGKRLKEGGSQQKILRDGVTIKGIRMGDGSGGKIQGGVLGDP